MQIGKLMEKAEWGQYALLTYLYQHIEPVSFKKVLSDMAISKVTLLKYIQEINERMQAENLAIFVCNQQDKLSLFIEEQISWQTIIQVFLANATKYHILMTLFKSERLSVLKLSQDLLVSEATLNRHIAGLNRLLNEFGLNITNGQLKGSEHQIRYFFFELFCKSWTEEQIVTTLKPFEKYQEMAIVERLCMVELTTHQKYQILLWFYITRHRIVSFKKDFKSLYCLMEPYETNQFYQQVKKAALYYFGHHAVEVDDGEAMCLFTFLVTLFPLPIYRMTYVLGFGGPIVEKTTIGIQLMKQAKLFQGDLNEQIMYILGRLFGQKYFFKGCILKYNNEYNLEDKLLDALLPKEHNGLAAYINQQTHFISETDVNKNDMLMKKIEWDITQLLCFVVEKVAKQLVVGVHIVENDVTSQNIRMLLKYYTQHNQYISIELYQPERVYDMVISDCWIEHYQQQVVYLLKGQITHQDICAILKHFDKCRA